MRKTRSEILAIVLAVSVFACTSPANTKSGAAAGEALLKMIPKDATGVLALDVQRLMTVEAVAKALQEPKGKEKLDEFIKMSGIDPTKDVYYAEAGLLGVPSGPASEGAIIISLKYDPAKLKALIKEKAPQAREEVYNGVTIYANIDGEVDQSPSRARLTLLDAGHIVLGSETGVKGVIDVTQKKADSLAKNAEMMALVKRVDKTGVLWAAFAVPPELLKKGMEASPQLKVLEGITGLALSFDDRPSGVVADIKTIGGNKEQNDNLASALNGFKALGAMAGGQEPTVGELLNGIVISAGTDYTDIAVNIPREVLEKLGPLARSKAGELMKPKKEGTPEEKK